MSRLEVVPTICALYDDCSEIEKARAYNYVVQRPPDKLNPFELAKSYLLSLSGREFNEMILAIEEMRE